MPLLLIFSTPVLSQQLPLQTEPASPLPAGTVQLEVAGSSLRDEPNYLTGLPRTTWAGPLLRLAYAPVESVELDVEWAVRVGQVDDPVYGSTSDWGDVTLRSKWRFAAQRGPRPALALRLAASLPETRAIEGLGPNTLRTSVELLASRASGRFAWHANLGLSVHDRPFPSSGQTPEQSDFLSYGLAGVLRATTDLDVVAEVAGRAGEGDPGASSRSEARLGLRYGRRKWRGAAALRHGLYTSTGRWGFEAGLVLMLHDRS
jgi:hypothetical protein